MVDQYRTCQLEFVFVEQIEYTPKLDQHFNRDDHFLLCLLIEWRFFFILVDLVTFWKSHCVFLHFLGMLRLIFDFFFLVIDGSFIAHSHYHFSNYNHLLRFQFTMQPQWLLNFLVSLKTCNQVKNWCWSYYFHSNSQEFLMTHKLFIQPQLQYFFLIFALTQFYVDLMKWNSCQSIFDFVNLSSSLFVALVSHFLIL